MADLKAKDYRRMFLEEIGFPLIKANAQRFLPEVGDLRKVENLRLVFDAAMRWKSQQAKPSSEKEEILEGEIRRKDSLLTDLRERVSELEQELKQSVSVPAVEDRVEPEVHLVNYLANTSEEEVRTIFRCFMPIDDEESSQKTYRKFAKFLHPDTTLVPKEKSLFLFNILHSSYKRVKDFAEEKRRLREFIDSDLSIPDEENYF